MSTEHFNGLNPAEAERLAILAEECGEVIQLVGKILRHGYENVWPATKEGKTNRERLQIELGDIMAILKVMRERADVDQDVILDHMTEKYRKIVIERAWIHHQ